MFNFDLKKAAIFRAIIWQRIFKVALSSGIRRVIFLIFFLSAASFLWGFLGQTFSDGTLSLLLGVVFLFSALFLTFWGINLFFEKELTQPRLKVKIKDVVADFQKYNLAEFLSFESAREVLEAMNFVRSKKMAETTSSALFYSLLSGNPKLNFIFSRVMLDKDNIGKILEDYFSSQKQDKFTEGFSQDFQEVIFESFNIASEKNHQRVELEDILPALAKKDPVFSKILVKADLRQEDIDNLTRWLESLKERDEDRKRFWDYKNLARHGSLAKEWAAGYTIALDKFSIDWTDYIKSRGFEKIIGHQEAIMQVERVLGRSDINNVLLVGEPGSGRGSIIQALAQKCLFGESLPSLNYKRVVELDMTTLLSQIENMEEVESVLDRIFREMDRAGNIILVINEFHNFIGQLVRPGVIDISGVISPYLKSSDCQILAVTTYAGLHRYIEQNPSMMSLFEKVEVSEISDADTIVLLENQALFLEYKYKKFITYPALREVVVLAKKYLTETPFPKKALDLLDEIVVESCQNKKEKLILPRHVAKIISEKTQIPVGEMGGQEKEVLLNLEDQLHKRIIGQEEAVSEVSTAIRRARAEISIRNGPMGTFLFLGPTGVGKTETSKALADIYFGSENKMVRLDMSEFQTPKDISRLIGTEGEEGLLTTKIRENPFSLILLDEFEKAHPDILNLFLQVFDEGHLTDGAGRKVDFKNSLIIATSNAGYKIILEAIKEKTAMSEIKNQLLDFLFKEGIFRPELINRFDAVVVFKSLTKENLMDIAGLLLDKLKKNLGQKGIDLKITEPLKEKMVDLGYSPVFGAREMRRVIQDKVENVLAVALLSEQIKRGDKVEIDPVNFNLAINKD
jgi:ATP-dependent Clp protease ATP-binding subunit ClpC